MSSLPDDARSLAQVGVDALQRGDARKARESFEQVVRPGETGAMGYLGLAYACRRLGDHPAALYALDKVLVLEPRNPRALILKADCMADMGDSRAASAAYQFAIQATPPDLDVPADLRSPGRRRCMHRGQHQMPGEARLQGDLRVSRSRISPIMMM